MSDPFSELVTYGYNRTGNQKLKVIIGNLSVTSDGQIPVSIQVHHGKTTDTTTYAGTYQKLQSQLTKADFLLIADSKLATPENLVTIACEYDGQFLSTATLTLKLTRRYLRLLMRILSLLIWQ